jgi:hypothetical protein
MDYERDQRDAEVVRLRAAHVPFRAIAERLNMSLGAVQKALRRYQKREHELSPELADLDAVAARYGLAPAQRSGVADHDGQGGAIPRRGRSFVGAGEPVNECDPGSRWWGCALLL